MISARFLRFLATGALNTAFGYALFGLLTLAGLAYPLAIGLATVAGVAFNYQSAGRLVFADARTRRPGRFVAVYALGYVLNVAAVAALLQVWPNVYLANAVAVGPIAVLTYLLQRNYVFGRP